MIYLGFFIFLGLAIVCVLIYTVYTKYSTYTVTRNIHNKVKEILETNRKEEENMKDVLVKLKSELDSYQKVNDTFCTPCDKNDCKECLHNQEKDDIDDRYMEIIKLIRGNKQ